MKKRRPKVNEDIRAAGFIVAMTALLLGSVWAMDAVASGPGYLYIAQTENEDVIRYSEMACERYPVCPELIQAVAFYESCNRMDVAGHGCVGYMGVNVEYNAARAKRLGVSVYDGYGNILVGTDLLFELCEKYEDAATALMVYHGEAGAVAKANAGQISDYAQKVLELSEKLERKHGK